MTVLLIDLSAHNNPPDWAALKAGGVAGVILKADEGTGYTNPVFAAWRAAAHAAGLAVGIYHFTDLAAPAAEAAHLLATVGALQLGEFTALDLEVSAAGVDPVGWAGQFIDALAARGIPVRLLYINQTFLADDWSPIVARGVRLWLADYDGSTTVPGPSGAWPAVTLKQFTDAATVPGETGAVDEDVLFGALTDLTTATTSPEGFLMALNDQQQADLYNTVMQKLGGAPLPVAVWDDLNANPLILERNGGQPRDARSVLGDIYVHTVMLLQAVGAQAAAQDPKALAAALAPLLTSATSSLSDADLQRIAAAVADEQAKRLAATGAPAPAVPAT